MDARAGDSVMHAIRQAGLPIAAQCGGACACATCHVYVDEEWLPRLPPMGGDEVEMIEFAEEAGPRSRLSCQITAMPELDGLAVALAPGTLI